MPRYCAPGQPAISGKALDQLLIDIDPIDPVYTPHPNVLCIEGPTRAITTSSSENDYE